MNTSAVQPTSPLPATRWAELVRARGLRATRDVLRVLLLLEASKAPETHESLMQALQAHPQLRTLHRPANLEDLFLKLTGRQIRE